MKYIIEVSAINETTIVPSDCNSITFYNRSSGLCTINNVPIESGASLSIEGNANEMDVTAYEIKCTGYIYIIRKFYK